MERGPTGLIFTPTDPAPTKSQPFNGQTKSATTTSCSVNIFATTEDLRLCQAFIKLGSLSLTRIVSSSTPIPVECWHYCPGRESRVNPPPSQAMAPVSQHTDLHIYFTRKNNNVPPLGWNWKSLWNVICIRVFPQRIDKYWGYLPTDGHTS